tara:strand:+ start:127 stop:1491 length:1365 start_codon:yes stop_codon:yes gene_type:complete
MTCNDRKTSPLTRREFLANSGMGMGLLGLGNLLSPDTQAAGIGGSGKIKRVLHIFLQGASSHIDTWDPKPALTKFDGKKINGDRLGHASKFEFTPSGQSGLLMSSAFPKLKQHADDICVIRSMTTDVPSHDIGVRKFNTGQISLPRPSMGSWVSYGLGSANDNLPSFIALSPGSSQRYAESYASSFIPGLYQGTPINTSLRTVDQMIQNIKNKDLSLSEQRALVDTLQRLNTLHSLENNKDRELENRIKSFETAYNMQIEAFDAFDISKEDKKTVARYGKGAQGRQLLLARRLLDKGVRFVQTWHGGWDHHDNLFPSLTTRARDIDGPLTALIDDLKAKGMWDSTLIIMGGEFGRSPHRDGRGPNGNFGRAHQATGFSTVLLSGGIKGGIAYGATDELGYKAAVDPVPVSELHDIILRTMGINPSKFTYRYNGRDFRLVLPEYLESNHYKKIVA